MEVRREATREGNLEATGEAPRKANCLNYHLDDCVLVTMNGIYHVYINKYIYMYNYILYIIICVCVRVHVCVCDVHVCVCVCVCVRSLP